MAGYLGSTPVPQATQHRESFTATSGQTTFATAGYTAGFVDVYLNGSHLSPADFTATNGSDVVLASGASADDVCDIISHSAFELNAQTFTGTTTMDVVTATGVVTANGGAVFNEGSADVDFRVESNGNANMLFVDGGNNAVGIKTNTPATNGQFSVRGAIATTNFGNVSGDFSDAATGSLKISHASNVVKLITDQALSLVTGTSVVAMGIDVTGAVTKPKQPAFLVEPASNQDNFAVGSADFVAWGTEIFDQNADFAGSTFTAPVTGRYHLDVHLYLESIDTAADYYQLQLITSNRPYYQTMDFGGHSADPVYGRLSLSVLADMDASDTATVKFQQVAGTAQTDIKDLSFFSGYLVA